MWPLYDGHSMKAVNRKLRSREMRRLILYIHGHARDTELVRVGHVTVSKKILVYIEIDIYKNMQGEETTERAVII
jgi:hypothetical protein